MKRNRNQDFMLTPEEFVEWVDDYNEGVEGAEDDDWLSFTRLIGNPTRKEFVKNAHKGMYDGKHVNNDMEMCVTKHGRKILVHVL